MATSPTIRKIYCLVRGPSPTKRVLDTLSEKGLHLDATSKSKIIALTADLSQSDLGLGNTFKVIQDSVTIIVHISWPVNFNLPLRTFEPHLAGLRNLIRLSMSVPGPEPARLFFASSVSVAFNAPADRPVPEAPIDDFALADGMGYAQSKLVGEHMVLNAARAGARSYVLRIGQVVGDSSAGIWNDREAIPSMIRSALALGALPKLGRSCSWLPVDTLATAITELCEAVDEKPLPRDLDAVDPPVIYNMVNPHEFSWDDLLGELKNTGLNFKSVATGDWLDMMRKSAANGDVEKNPAVKLLDYYEREYAAREAGSYKSQGVVNGLTNGFTNGLVNGAGKKLEANGQKASGLRFDTTMAQEDCAILRAPPRLLEDGYINKFVAAWLPKWRDAAADV